MPLGALHARSRVAWGNPGRKAQEAEKKSEQVRQKQAHVPHEDTSSAQQGASACSTVPRCRFPLPAVSGGWTRTSESSSRCVRSHTSHTSHTSQRRAYGLPRSWVSGTVAGLMTDEARNALALLRAGSRRDRCDALRGLCPCRNNRVRDLAVWREIFRTASDGGPRERHQAAHAVSTLTQKARVNPEWRALLQALKDDLHRLMGDTRASRALLAEMKPSRHAARGAAMRTYRRRRRALDATTPAELAAWVNARLGLRGRQRVSGTDPGVRRLSRWMQHRVAFQPARATKETDLLAQARRFLPRLFQRTPGPGLA